MNKTLINHNRKEYHRTKSNKGWSKIIQNEENKIITLDHLSRWEDSIKGFNRMGYCKGEKSYTSIGYVISRIITHNPDKTVKYVDSFDVLVINEVDLYKEMGNREKLVYNTLDYFKRENHNGKQYIVFYSDQIDSSFMIEKNTYKIVG